MHTVVAKRKHCILYSSRCHDECASVVVLSTYKSFYILTRARFCICIDAMSKVEQKNCSLLEDLMSLQKDHKFLVELKESIEIELSNTKCELEKSKLLNNTLSEDGLDVQV